MRRLIIFGCILISSFGLYLPSLVASNVIGTLNQSPPNYQPEFTAIVGGVNTEHVRKAPEGLVGNDSVNDRVLFGYQKDGFGTGGDFGIKVSQEGFDVRTASNDQLIMSSAFNLFKIVQSGTATVALGGTLDQGDPSFYIATTTVAHGLDHIPAYVGYIRGLDSLGNSRDVINILPYYFVNILTGTSYLIEVIATMEVDATNITFTVRADDSAFQGDYNFQYYLLEETIGI